MSQGLLFILCTPLWEGWDEAFHYSYIQGLVEHRSLPVYGRSFISTEITTSFENVPLSYATNLSVGRHYTTFEDYWKLPAEERRQRKERLKNIPAAKRADFSDSRLGLFNYEAHHPPLYYLLCAPIYYSLSSATLPTRVFFLRLFSLVIASLTIILAFSAAETTYSEYRHVVLVPLLIALLPLFYCTVARISNDSLAVMLFSALVVLVLRYFRDSRTTPDAFRIGVVLGLGLLTKAYFLTAVPALIVIFTGAWVVERSNRRLLGHLGLIGLLAVTIAGWWYFRNYLLYGHATGMQELIMTSNLSTFDRLRAAGAVPWIASIKQMLTQHIWIGNTSSLRLSGTTYTIGYVLISLCVLGAVKQWISVSLAPTSSWGDAHRRNVMILGAFYTLFVIGVFYHMLVSFLTIHVPGGTGGWYLYAAIIPEVILLVYGLEGVTGPKAARGGTTILVVYVVVVNLLSVFAKSLPFYAGFFIPNFHVQHLVQLYSPSSLKLMLEHLAVNKPPFVTPGLIGIFIAAYVVLVGYSVTLFLRGVEERPTPSS